jgi:hypothetical protein
MLRIAFWKKSISLISLGVLVALAAMTFTLKPKTALADDRDGYLSVTKDCKDYTGLAGSSCTIEFSNIPEITKGSMVFYDQPLWATVTPATFEGGYIALDSNVVLWVSTDDWAVGRCTLGPTFSGICTFSDGTGQLAGFHAHVKVSPSGGTLYSWEGTYSFRPESPK